MRPPTTGAREDGRVARNGGPSARDGIRKGVAGKTDFGALTEVSNLHRADEEFRRMAPDLPAAAGGENSAP